ncbi:MAG: single-stranded-DNA-specific exonuclease RecJ [Chitinophagaceae bacterium]|nr:single-stranded-DNA-specific exonuclease RecJ [Chitinophagaceae bacterium]MCW5914172.1 single-stranded-DNA-specific exonuclease RecJ [Chitinophagaceae bacterium]MCZ2395094.1 single-stranded-DNA-specific exonuclease RecJ [Chitinophagales bacterium]
MKEKRWIIATPDREKVQQLKNQFNQFDEALCAVFVSRGLDTAEKLQKYFRPDYSLLHDPFLMKDMQLAVERILAAVNSGERIVLFGDYDVDGTTAVATLYRFLTSVYEEANIFYYIPDRHTEGYGISRKGIAFAKTIGASLFISLDCGITAVEEAELIKEKNIDLIICDHHLPGDALPVATAILNPKQPGCSYPYKELSGCGVAFKLITALSRALKMEETSVYKYLDMVATSIGADIVPITGENRVLSQLGLKVINASPATGLKALINTTEKKGTIDMYFISFLIAPRINAAGRLRHAKIAVELLLENDPVKAAGLAEQLNQYNNERKQLDDTITKEALDILVGDQSFTHKKTTVVYCDQWHKGVIGIVASRLIENYYRPTIVLTRDGDLITGSARSVSGFDLHKAISHCSAHLEKFGGHKAAAGLSMIPENYNEFASHFETIVSETITEESLSPKIYVDAIINLRDINFTLYRTISSMEPFGPGNHKPVFASMCLQPSNWTRIVGDKHVRFHFNIPGMQGINGIAFNMKDKFESLAQNAFIDIAFTIDENLWNGNSSLQLKIIDFRASQSL